MCGVKKKPQIFINLDKSSHTWIEDIKLKSTQFWVSFYDSASYLVAFIFFFSLSLIVDFHIQPRFALYLKVSLLS